jgi:hypothetical protein
MWVVGVGGQRIEKYRSTLSRCWGDLVSRKVELVFAAFFAWFVYGWLTFDIPEAFGLDYNMTAWYAREIDPLFRDPPSWLKIFGWYEVAYGPFFAAISYGFLRVSRGCPMSSCRSAD